MRECPNCHRYYDGDKCPICEVPLLSEYSNNDGNDGVFSDPPADEEIVVDNP